ncbi:uncharacterized protein [Nicotiana sylvestris]|uniref:uncharacterized protein n=1 Tax=Nicotiana sylvestris TaxID=4096 RepID=UPI00388CD50D
MTLVLRYVNKEGKLIEQFLSTVHAKDTTALSLQKEIHSLLLEHSLSRSQIRGHCYEGASNMQGEINRLKTLILKDTPSSYCIHCFAHQLHMTLVAIEKKQYGVDQLEMLREDEAQKLEELLVLGKVDMESGQNQELGLQRTGDTHWGSHVKTVRNFIALFSSIIHVLEVLANEGAD